MHLTKYLHQQGSRVLLDEAILSTYTLRYFLSHREERQVVKPMKIHKIVKKKINLKHSRVFQMQLRSAVMCMGEGYVGSEACMLVPFNSDACHIYKQCA